MRRWASTLAVIVLWQLVAALELLPPAVLPGPITLLRSAAAMVVDGSLPGALAISLARVLAGSAVGIVLGLLLGLVAGLWRVGEDLVDRPVQMLRTIPFTALTPLLILWFGLGEAPKIALIVIATVVPVYLNTFSGVRAVDPKLVEVATVYRLSARQRAVLVLLPGALAPVLVGLRYALGLAWIAVIVAETVNPSAGVGHLLTTARTYVRTDIMLICVAVYAALGLLTDTLVRLVETRLLRWRAPALPAATRRM
ncbi:ABC transporter permease [Pseudactinotalea terrae]|uniref:ABC transporter permease n=1 Tax=Pseudactinotalea terrae TaxID=1743262 RepID=UPI0019D684E5|nr:ABC transporter permease [Pseudactinotalea terrae]